MERQSESLKLREVKNQKEREAFERFRREEQQRLSAAMNLDMVSFIFLISVPVFHTQLTFYLIRSLVYIHLNLDMHFLRQIRSIGVQHLHLKVHFQVTFHLGRLMNQIVWYQTD